MEATYKSGRALAVATALLLTVMTMLRLADEVVVQLTMLERGTFDATGAEARLALIRHIGTCTLLAHLATIVLFSMWVYRATANLPALGSISTRFTPARAVWAFFIPFVNLVRAYQVMAMIWTESQPRALTDAGHLKPRSIVIVNFWYALWLGGWVVSAVVGAFLADLRINVGTTPVVGVYMVSFVVNAAAAILCAIMVCKADARQHAQADDLERRANLPQPTGSELR
jgi:hypothetical protein